MNISNELLSLIREHKPLIQGISETAAFIPVEGNVADDGGYDPESSRRRILLQYELPAITVVGSLL